MQDITSLLCDESFQRWLSGSASSDETSRWETWLSDSAANREQYQGALELWRLGHYRASEAVNVDQEWAKLSKRLGLAEKPAFTSESRSSLQSLHERRRRTSWSRFGVAAFATAAAVAILVLYSQFQNPAEIQNPAVDQVVSTEYGQRATLNLPDGTRIILNANSTLKYPAVWNHKSPRGIELHGEAYFDVIKVKQGSGEPFAVSTGDGLIEVLGTKFVVHERGQGTRVVVEKGSVQVEPAGTEPDRALPDARVQLQEGQLLEFEKDSRQMSPLAVDVRPYVTWWHRQLVLWKTSFQEIVQRLEDTYGVEVKVLDATLLTRTLSGSIENQNVVAVTDALANALRVPVQRKGELIIFGKPSNKEVN